MSSWVDRKRQEAFALYQAYNAMRLHFKGATGFDYAAYGGKLRGSFESFLEKNQAVQRFMKVAMALRSADIDFERFVFVNARYDLDIGYGDIRPCIKKFEEWNTRYGTKANLARSASGTFKSHYFSPSCKTATDVLMSLIDSDEPSCIEAIISYLHFKPDTLELLKENIKGNAIYELRIDKMLKIRSLYYYFGILN